MSSREHREATERAARHRRQAGDLYAQHRREGGDDLLDRAKQESAKAAHWEGKAQAASSQSKEAFNRDGEAAKDTERRAWYAPGSVADDKLLQFDEARQGGILDAVSRYAARSTFDREHRTFDGAKAVGRAASAPFRAARGVASRQTEPDQAKGHRSPSVLQELGKSGEKATRQKARQQEPEKARQKQQPRHKQAREEPER